MLSYMLTTLKGNLMYTLLVVFLMGGLPLGSVSVPGMETMAECRAVGHVVMVQHAPEVTVVASCNLAKDPT